MDQNLKYFFKFQIYDRSGAQLHPDEGFTGTEVPEEIVSANGEMQIRFVSGATESARGFSAVFSADCPELKTGEGMCNYNMG